MLSIALLLLGLFTTTPQEGELVSRYQQEGNLIVFAKTRDAAFFKMSSGLQIRIQLLPEMDCFLANHPKDDLRVNYSVYDVVDSSGKKRLNKMDRIVSLRNGDDTKTWTEKEQANPELLARHHEALKKYMEEMEGVFR
jgi:hypothetical protein